jgi:hypothetical protein
VDSHLFTALLGAEDVPVSASDKAAYLFKPWAGLAIGMTAIAIAHQFGADGTFDHCGAIAPVPLMVVALVAVIAAFLAAVASAAVLRDPDSGRTRRLAAFVSIGMAAFGIFSLLLPMAASLILPPCFQ